MTLDLTGKRCLVTGSTRGIGQTVAQRFAEAGARVIVHGRDESKASEVAASLPNHAEHVGLAADLSTSEGAAGLVNQALEITEGLDVIVNNAGVTADNLILRMSDDEWSRVLATNLTSAFAVCRAASRPLVRQRSGCIINMTSVVGIRGQAGQANYAASKAGLIGFTKSLARELASRSIRVNAVAPGFIETDMTDAMTDQAKQEILSAVPMGRMGATDDIANAVLFLASEMASYITGQVIVVDGGLVM